MEPDQNAVHDSSSRIYSLARMKRRARQMNKENSGVWLYTNKEAGSTMANYPAPSNTICYLPKKDIIYSSPEAVANKSEFDVPSSGIIGATAKPISWKEFSYSSVDNVLNRRNSFSERISVGSSWGRKTRSVKVTPYGRSVVDSLFRVKTPRMEFLAKDKSNAVFFVGRARNYESFTQLCQKYDKTGKGGPSRLTEVLNGYIGSMIDIVLSRNGDVCKFGGDAFLCMWKVTDDMNIMQIVNLAIDSAVDIQKKCGEHKTDVGVKLRVKIAVAAGKAVFSIIGTESRKYYVIAGPPIVEARDAEQLCGPGDVIVAPSAWKYVSNYMFYSYTYHSDNNHIKVHDFGPLWKSSKIGFKNLERGGQSSSSQPLSKYISRMRVEDFRPFILPPVMKSIDLNQSLDYLTEMRQVSIVFFNVAVDYKSVTLDHLLKLTDKTFQVITAVVDKSGGATNKLTLFDKDMAILAVFGLKGFKHELASQVALKCAYSCLEYLKKLGIFSVSAGVTTGMAYCGVIGHKLRKEYTVMGNPVNLAARLMCAYKNIVSSDRETFLYSKLESSHFEVLEQQNLKGIQSSGPFYKFILRPKRTKVKFNQDAHPLLGRGKEITEFEVFLRNSMKRKDAPNFMVIFGEARIGKTRLLSRLFQITEKYVPEGSEISVRRRRINRKRNYSLETCVISLTEDESKVSYSASRLMFQHFLGLSELSSMEERQEQILSRLVEVKDLFLLASLNPVFNVNFELMPQYLALSEEDQTSARKILVKNLYSKCHPKGDKWLIMIDDAEFMDQGSWNLLMWCSEESDRALYLLTVGQRKALTPLALNCLENMNAIKITLTEIDKWYFAGLACQILEVRAVPLELINLLQTHKSSGNPGWLESFLLSLLQSGRIYVDQMPPDKIKSMGLVTVPVIMLARNVAVEVEKFDNSYWMECLETFEQISDPNEIMRVCLLGPNFLTANDVETELTMDVMFIKTIDTLYPLEQLVLKAGSVLGNNLKRSALKFLISKDTQLVERKLAKGIVDVVVGV